MKRRYKNRYKSGKRRRSFKDSNFAPIFKLILSIIGILALIAALVYLLLPWGLARIGVEFYPPFVEKPTPVPTPEPTPTPNPLALVSPEDIQQEVIIPGSEYRWFSDPYFFGGKLLLTAGQNINGTIKMDTLFLYDFEAREATKLPITLKNTHFVYPVFNDDYICYLDANADGGGELMLYNRRTMAGSVPIKTVYAGHPKLSISGNYLTWTERTGSSMDKLFVCDLSTLESTTLNMFVDSYYGMSFPFIYDNTIIWAGDDTDNASIDVITSMIHRFDIGGSQSTIKVGTYVHDPQFNGKYYAWMDGNHGVNTKLYVMADGASEPKAIATGVVEFGMGDDFVAYGMEDAIYVYVFSVDETFRITGELQLTQFLGASGNCAMWMDVTSRDKDILKLADLSIVSAKKTPQLGS